MALASNHGRVRGEKWPGIDCLRMRDHSQEICLRLEIVSKTNTYTYNVFPYHRKMQPFASWTTFNSRKVEDNRCVYEGKNAFSCGSFGKSVRYEVLSFVCWV